MILINYYQNNTIEVLNKCNELLTTQKKILTQQLKKGNTIISCTNSISETIHNLNYLPNPNAFYEMANKTRQTFKAINSNVSKCKEIIDILNSLKNSLDNQNNDDIILNIEWINNNYTAYTDILHTNDIIIDEFLEYYLKNSQFIFDTKTNSNIKTIPEQLYSNNLIFPEKENISIKTKDIEIINDAKITSCPLSINELEDNRVLTISEKEGKVFLPYLKEDIEKLLNENDSTNIEDIINNYYTVPLSRFNHPIISRFKEAFNLMKNKEQASLIECLDLAFELSVNSLLNPAVILACRDLNELDIYLDCLANNELDQFKIFDVKYEVAPILKK